jgi:hypothetical protein
MLAAAVLGLVLASSALPQSGGFQPIHPPVWAPGGRPVLLNPYLNLIRGGDPSANYFLGTLAEFQRRQNAYTFRTDIEDLNARMRTAPEELPRPRPPVPSGTYALLNNTGGYFNNTSVYFPNAGVPPPSVSRPGVYAPPPRPAGAPSRYGFSPGFPANPNFPPR